MCTVCSTGVEYEGGYSLWNYNDSHVKLLISQIKFHAKPHLLRIIREFSEEIATNNILRDSNCITYVPMHRKDIVKRGFNQAMIIAKHLSSILGIKICFSMLRKTKLTPHQVGLTVEERRTNLKGAFEINKLPTGVKKVLVVDDVLTTGSTLNECSRVLKSAEVKVRFFTLASTPPIQD